MKTETEAICAGVLGWEHEPETDAGAHEEGAEPGPALLESKAGKSSNRTEAVESRPKQFEQQENDTTANQSREDRDKQARNASREKKKITPAVAPLKNVRR
jgi:hypothetical protein